MNAHDAQPGSDRVFGLFFAAVSAGFGAYALWKGREWAWIALGLAAALALLAAFAPGLLHGLNRAWHALGLALGRIVTPVVVAILFFVVVTPMGLLMRALGKRPLNLRLDPRAATYWIERSPHGPAPASMKDQF